MHRRVVDRCALLLLSLAAACGSRSGLLEGREQPSWTAGGAAGTGTGAGGREPNDASGGRLEGKPDGGAGNAGAASAGGTTSGSAGTDTTGDGGTSGAGEIGGQAGGGGTAGQAGGGEVGGQAGAADLEDPIWARRFGDDAEQYAYGIAVEPDGDSFITGRLWGTTDFGKGALTDPENGNLFLVKFSADGDTLWSKGYGDEGGQAGTSVTVDSTGAVAVAGWFSGNVDFGAGSIASQGGQDLLVAKLDADQNLVFGKGFGSSDNQSAHGIAATTNDDLVIGGEFRNQVDLGGGTLTTAGSNDALVGQFLGDGSHDWSFGYGNTLAQRARAVAATSGGQALVTGEFQGLVDFGSGSMTSAGQRDVFLARLDEDGSCLKSFQFGDSGDQRANAVAFREWSYGRTAIAGAFSGTLSFGSNVSISATDDPDAYVAVLRDSGAVIFAARIGGAGEQTALGVTFDASSNVIVTGSYEGSIDDDTLPPSAGGRDIFVIKYDRFGTLLWAKRFGDEYDQVGFAVGADGNNGVLVAGAFEGSIPLATETLTSTGLHDIFVMKLAP